MNNTNSPKWVELHSKRPLGQLGLTKTLNKQEILTTDHFRALF